MVDGMGAGHDAKFNTRSHGTGVQKARFHAQFCQSSNVTDISEPVFSSPKWTKSHGLSAFSAAWDRTK